MRSSPARDIQQHFTGKAFRSGLETVVHSELTRTEGAKDARTQQEYGSARGWEARRLSGVSAVAGGGRVCTVCKTRRAVVQSS